MQASKLQETPTVCEACDKEIINRVMIGIEANLFTEMPIRLCENCGPIDLDLMQFCREIRISCNQN